MFEAYFDDSSRDEVAVIGGVIGTKDAWSRFETEARAFIADLADKGVSFFHMSEMLMQDGQYKRIDTPTINFAITQMAKLLGNMASELRPIYSGVLIDDWNRVVTDKKFLNRFPSPMDLCFDDILRQLWEWGANHARHEKIAPIFAQANESKKRVGEIRCMYDKDDWYRKILEPISFGQMSEIVPLWAADFIAHQMSQDIKKTNYEPFSLAHGGPTKALFSATPKGTVGHYFDAPSLIRAVAQFNETGKIYR